MTDAFSEPLVCYHCWNKILFQKIATHRGRELYEWIDDKPYYENFEFHIVQCPTCQGISIYGNFSEYTLGTGNRKIYPPDARLLPESHKLAQWNCIPEKLMRLYEEVLPLRHISPNAFVWQIRRCLEFICLDQGANGATLFKKLKNLETRWVFPWYFSEMTDLMRQMGNLGAHAGEDSVDFWDAELLDDFFRSVVEYLYVAPLKIERMRERVRWRNGAA